MKRRMNLQKKAIAVVATILFIILSINTAVLTYVASNKYKAAILEKTAAIGESMQRELSRVLELGVPIDSLEGVNEKLKELSAVNARIGYAMITDTRGRVLFHSDPNSAGRELRDAASQAAAAADKLLIQAIGPHFDLALPLRGADGKTAGALRIGVQRAAVQSQIYSLLFWAVAISSLCFLLSLFLVHTFISRAITRPIMSMERAADRIASGDLTATIDLKGDDEIASLGRAIGRMTFNLKDMISKISAVTSSVSTATKSIASTSQGVLGATDIQKESIEATGTAIEEMDTFMAEVTRSTGSLSVSATDTSSAMLEMSASIERIAENSNVFSETANETASSIEEMISTIKQIAESIENLSASSDAIASSIDEVNAATRDIENRAKESVNLAERVMNNASDRGSNAARAATDGMEEIKKSVVALADVINMLGTRTGDIGKILTVIDDVADQTNLLALNAAILASKAGEHGKGFSIVADEIKNLAERASVSTSEIASLIKSVQEVTKSSIRMSSDGIQTVEKGIQLVRDLDSALGEIIDSSRASTEMAKAIQRATAEESAVLKQITSAVEGMTEQTETIARAIQEQSKGSKLIIESTERVKEIARHVKNATGEQKDGSRQIALVIENVMHQTSQIADSIGKQKEKSALIVRSMNRIHEVTGRLSASAREMNSVVEALKDEAVNLVREIQKFKV